MDVFISLPLCIAIAKTTKPKANRKKHTQFVLNTKKIKEIEETKKRKEVFHLLPTISYHHSRFFHAFVNS